MRRCPHCLGDIDTPEDFDPGIINELVDIVAERLVVKADRIFSHSRDRRVCDARNACISAAYQLFGLSSPQLGRIFNRDHTTILHSLKRADKRLVEAIIEDLVLLLPQPSTDTAMPATTANKVTV